MPTSQNNIPGKITDRLEVVRERIIKACQRVGRNPSTVTLIGVTKTFPVELIQEAIEAGLVDFGENKVQEFVSKAEQIPGKVSGGNIRWHMIGHLQRNKARDVVEYADCFHALDSLRLAQELDKRASREKRILDCFVQVNVSSEESKFGIHPDMVRDFLNDLVQFENLKIRGLMTLASPVDDPEDVRSEFRKLKELQESYISPSRERVNLEYLSMGMSGDYEVAIEEGASHVRIGSAIFGSRNYQ